MRHLYTIALRLALPLILLRLWWRGRREPGYREGVEERFGFYTGPQPEKVLWVHAVSVGEARAAAPLVRALKEALPDHAVLMTGTTAAGRETIKQVYGESVIATFLPDYQGYRVKFYPVWENYPGPDMVAATRRMNEFIEERVKEAPAEYFWTHKRFKTRPEGEPSFYSNQR